MSRHRNPTPRKYTLAEIIKAWLTPSRHFNPYAAYKEPQA